MNIRQLTAPLRNVSRLFALVALGALSACGGGGGSSNPPPPVATAPTITTQPAAQTATVGAMATFTVVADGTAPLTYQWQVNGTNVAGATSASYTTPALVITNNTDSYRVVVSNSAGSATSNAAVLTVTAAPTITTQPGPATVTEGATATFSVVAAGTAPLTYQWQRNGTNIAGATAASYTTPATTIANSGESFRVVITNATGSVTSTTASLTVNGVPPAIAANGNPASVTVNDGAAASFTVVATGTPTLTYQWQRNSINITGATNSTYAIANALLSDSGATYRVIVSNGIGSPATSTAATLTVNPVAPSITTQPAAAPTVNEGSSITLTVVATGSAPLTFQWRKGGTPISGAPNSASYTISNAVMGDAGAYSVRITNPSATAVISNNSVLTVTQTQFAPSIPTGTPASLTRTEGTSATFSVTASGTGTLTYQWRKGVAPSVVDIPGATNSSYTIAQPTIEDNGAVYSVVVTGAVSPAATSGNATLTVTRAPIGLVAGMLGGAGTLDETGTAAQFYNPASVAVDTDGTVYVSDSFNNTIRKMTAAGVVTTFVGKAGVAGFANGTGNVARFNSPRGIAIDPVTHDLYVADRYNHLIRKVTPAGVVSRLAGNQTAGGTDNADPLLAQFNQPMGVSLNTQRTVLYVADFGGHKIRTISLSAGVAGAVGTLAGTGTGGYLDDAIATQAQFNQPADVIFQDNAAPADDVLYVADSLNTVIRKITLNGTNAVTTLAGQAGGFSLVDAPSGPGSAAQFNLPIGLALAGTDLIVGDASNNAIRRVNTSTGAVTTIAGLVTSGAASPAGSLNATGSAARVREPRGVAYAPGTSTIYVADFGNHQIRAINTSNQVTTTAGSPGGLGAANGSGTAARFNNPRGIAADSSGKLYVADTYNNVIRVVLNPNPDTAPGSVNTTYGDISNPTQGYVDGTGTAVKFNGPYGLAVKGDGSVIYVADTGNNRIRRITVSGGVVDTIAGTGVSGAADGTGATATFNQPTSVTLGASENELFVTDFGSHTIRRVDLQTGNNFAVTTVAGQAGAAGSTDAAGTAARFNNPLNIVYTPVGGGTLYISDQANAVIRAISITAAYNVTTFVGSVGSPGYTDGTTTSAQLSTPRGLAVDGNGDLWLAEFGNHDIRKITSAGAVTLAAGDPVTPKVGVQLGALLGSLNGPSGVAVVLPSAPGTPVRFFITDAAENSVLQITAP